MKSTKFKLLSTTATPLAAAAMLAVGMAGTAAADCGYGQKSAALPEAQARDGEIILAMSHEKKMPCAPNPCAAADKAKDMANPCAAIDKGADKAKEMANPCAAKPCAPCAPKSQ